jgi:hypothetical protein
MKNLFIIPVGVIALMTIHIFLGPASLFCTIGGLIAGHLIGQMEIIEWLNANKK